MYGAKGEARLMNLRVVTRTYEFAGVLLDLNMQSFLS